MTPAASPRLSFSALKVTTLVTSGTSENYNVVWWAQGKVRVKIVNYPASNPGSTQTWELTGFGVAPVP